MSLERAMVEFLVSSHESLDRIEGDLVALEEGRASLERLDVIFRAVHTIKGTCGFLGLPRLEEVVHQGESLLGLLRARKATPDHGHASALLALVDVVRRLLLGIEASGAEPPGVDVAPVVELLRRQAAALEAAPAPGAAEVAPEGGEALALAQSTVRVDVGVLDRLMNLVGELVLVRNQLLQLAGRAAASSAAFVPPAQRLNLLTTELQEGVMKTRMQPIANVWSKLPRVVRDLSLATGKQARVTLEGSETELDRAIIEGIRDPLVHLVRNAVDHGLEAPEVRRAHGKPPEGRVALRAYHEGGNVNIEVSDDGAGIDARRVAAKAVQRGLLTAAQATQASDRELLGLVFRAGFSTTEAVTTVSGRGVGLDVVKSNVEAIGGAVDLQTRPGDGTTVHLKIPLTLAIIPVLIVNGGGQRYALPQPSVLEVVRVEEGHALETVLGALVFRLRGRLLTLLDLDAELGGARTRAAAAGYVVVLQTEGERSFGLLVESVEDTEEIVVKPLGRHVKGISLFAGATIMGDGRVALILDVLGLAERASLLGKAREALAGAAAAPAARDARDGEHQALLLVELAPGERAAIPLAAISRLEEVPAARVERVGGQEVVQYREQIMALVRVQRALGRDAAQGEGAASLSVVVCEHEEGAVGLVVGRILDVVDEVVTLRRASPTPGVLCTAIVQERVTEVLDVPRLLARGLATAAAAS